MNAINAENNTTMQQAQQSAVQDLMPAQQAQQTEQPEIAYPPPSVAQQHYAQAPYGDGEALVQQGVQAITGQQALNYAKQVQSVVQFNDPDLYYPGQSVKQGITVFLYGDVGTWKTSWAAQWPRTVFLSVGTEGGDDALAMLPSLYGIPAPPSYRVTSTDIMSKKISLMTSAYKQLGINTIVIDSLTYYMDLWITELLAIRYNDPKIRKKIEETGGSATILTQRDWGVLSNHIRDLAIKLHKTELNVIWIALEKEVKDRGEQSSGAVLAVDPYISGETLAKLPGMCKMIIHATKDLRPDPNVPGKMVVRPVYYTSPTWKTKKVRHKYGNAFPEGKLVDPQYGDMPTFNAIYNRVGNFVYMT